METVYVRLSVCVCVCVVYVCVPTVFSAKGEGTRRSGAIKMSDCPPSVEMLWRMWLPEGWLVEGKNSVAFTIWRYLIGTYRQSKVILPVCYSGCL